MMESMGLMKILAHHIPTAMVIEGTNWRNARMLRIVVVADSGNSMMWRIAVVPGTKSQKEFLM